MSRRGDASKGCDLKPPPKTWLNRYRREADISQSALADAMTISERNLSRLENGKVKNPRIRYLTSAAKALGLDDWLLLLEDEWGKPLDASSSRRTGRTRKRHKRPHSRPVAGQVHDGRREPIEVLGPQLPGLTRSASPAATISAWRTANSTTRPSITSSAPPWSSASTTGSSYSKKRGPSRCRRRKSLGAPARLTECERDAARRGSQRLAENRIGFIARTPLHCSRA
jgi:transcriptional regulator with XRE-family HTH domain